MPEITKWGSETVLTQDYTVSSPAPAPPYDDLVRFIDMAPAQPVAFNVIAIPMIYWVRTVTSPLGPFAGGTDSNVYAQFREGASLNPYVGPVGPFSPSSTTIGIGNDGVSSQFGSIQEADAAFWTNNLTVGWIGHGSSIDVLSGQYSLQVTVTPVDQGFGVWRGALPVTASAYSDLSLVQSPAGLALVYVRSPTGYIGGSVSDDINVANSAGVYMRIIPPDLNASYTLTIGPEIRVNNAVAGSQIGADAASLGSNFVVAWNDNNAAVRAKIYTSAGAVVTSDFAVATGVVSGNVSVAALIGGGFAVTWSQSGEVLARVFDAVGNALGAAIQVNDFTVNNQELPQIIGSADGGFVVTFIDSSFTAPDTGDPALRAQKFDASGGRVGANILVPTTLAGTHAHHELSMTGDGRIVVTWSNESDGGPVSRMQILDDRGALIYGDTAANIIYGADTGAYANNVLVLGAGNDGGYGLAGDDYLYGGDGNDALAGGAGVDVVLGEAGADNLFGEDGSDYIYGGADNDVMNGGAGVDVLIGEGGDDIAFGGDGGDFFYGGDGADTANGEAGNDIFVMEAGADIANGGEGQDYFYMGAGNDVMTGGAGVDVMLGEAGNDTFNSDGGVDYVYLGPKGAGDNDNVTMTNASGTAVVYDFEAGGANDVLRLLGTQINSFAQAQAAVTDYSINGFIVITVDADTNIWLIGVTPGQLTAADFLFV